MLKNFMIALFFLILCFSLFAKDNLIINGSFEKEYLGNLFLWSTSARFQEGSTSHFGLSEEGALEGKRHVVVENKAPNASSFYQWIRVKPDSFYRISAYIKTSGLDRNGQGACISILGSSVISPGVHETHGFWQPVFLLGRSGKSQEVLGIALSLGTKGNFVSGMAYFDSVACISLDPESDEESGFQSLNPQAKGSGESALVKNKANLLLNSDFEWFEDDIPVMWHSLVWDARESAARWEQNREKSFSGSSSVMIQLNKLNDAMFQQWVLVKPWRTYRLSGWILAEADKSGLQGAFISVLGLSQGPPALWNTHGEWQYFEMIGRTGRYQKILPVITRLGDFGYGAKGRAYFDGLSLSEVQIDSAETEVYDFSNPVIEELVKDEPSVIFNLNWILLLLLSGILVFCLGITFFLIIYHNRHQAILNKDNQRHSTRHHFSSYAEVKLPDPEGGFRILEFQVMDLSLNGVFLMSEDLNLFEIGDELELDIRLKGKIYPVALAEVVRKEDGFDDNDIPRQMGYGVRLVIKDRTFRELLQEK